MIDLELLTVPTDTALDVVSVDDLASHLRLSASLRTNATWIANMTAAIEETVDSLHGRSGVLNRTVLPCTWKRTMDFFPKTGMPILLPYPDLISVDAITIEDGSIPANELDPDDYWVKKTLIPEIYATSVWPILVSGTRVSVTYKAGYGEYPAILKRLVKILAAHNLENPEATINEVRQMAINRRIDFGVDSLMAQLRIPVSYDDWSA